MNILKKYKFLIQNLSCANCAAKIQDKLSKEDGFKNVILNFGTSKLSFETDKKNPKELVSKIAYSVESNVEILEENTEVKNSYNLFPIFRLLIGLLLAAVGFYVALPYYLNTIFILSSYVILLYRTSKKAIILLFKSKTIDENFLITISCIGAYLVGKHMEGLMVIVLYEIGKILEERAVHKTRKSIKDLMDIKPEYANLKVNGEYKKILPNEVNIGDIVLVKHGERIPLDGKIISGNASLDTSALTGESLPRLVKIGDEVLSGSINMEGLIEIQITCEYENSTVNKILELVENATDKKAKTETFVSKAAKIYTPIVLGLAILVAIFMPLLIKNVTYSQSIYRALIFLVISCPCAIAISVPLSYFSGIGRASKSGILVKGSDFLDGLKDIKEIIFDKTGTLTTGSFNVSEINSFNSSYTENDVLNYIAIGESFSNHPLAKSILKAIDFKIENSNVINFEEVAGQGIRYSINNNEVKIGNSKFANYANGNNQERCYLFVFKYK